MKILRDWKTENLLECLYIGISYMTTKWNLIRLGLEGANENRTYSLVNK